jgi:hypothetical protein
MDMAGYLGGAVRMPLAMPDEAARAQLAAELQTASAGTGG